MELRGSGKSFNSRHLSPCRLHREDQTGVYQDAVQQHTAGTAITVATTLFGPGEPEFVAEDLQQALPGFTEKINLFPIDTCLDMYFRHDSTSPLWLWLGHPARFVGSVPRRDGAVAQWSRAYH